MRRLSPPSGCFRPKKVDALSFCLRTFGLEFIADQKIPFVLAQVAPASSVPAIPLARGHAGSAKATTKLAGELHEQEHHLRRNCICVSCGHGRRYDSPKFGSRDGLQQTKLLTVVSA